MKSQADTAIECGGGTDGPVVQSVRADWFEARTAMEQSGYKHRADGRRRRHRRWFDRCLTLGALGLRAFGLYGRGRRNALDINLARDTLMLPGLPPAFDGYTILQISDSHLDYLPDLARQAAALVRGLTIDLVALTGDYRGDVRGPYMPSLLPLGDILSTVSASDAQLAILGNHDCADMVAPLEAMGLGVLINEHVSIDRGDTTLHVTGIDDVHHFFSSAAPAALHATPKGFSIALSHSPEAADMAAAAGFDLFLCGHTHGGQICLPGGRPIIKHVCRCRAYAAGTWQCGDMVGRTSSGLGVSGIPVRFNSRGEIALLTLRCGE